MSGLVSRFRAGSRVPSEPNTPSLANILSGRDHYQYHAEVYSRHPTPESYVESGAIILAIILAVTFQSGH